MGEEHVRSSRQWVMNSEPRRGNTNYITLGRLSIVFGNADSLESVGCGWFDLADLDEPGFTPGRSNLTVLDGIDSIAIG